MIISIRMIRAKSILMLWSLYPDLQQHEPTRYIWRVKIINGRYDIDLLWRQITPVRCCQTQKQMTPSKAPFIFAAKSVFKTCKIENRLFRFIGGFEGLRAHCAVVDTPMVPAIMF